MFFLLFLHCKKQLPQNPYYRLFQSHQTTDISSYKPVTGWNNRIAPISALHIDYIKQMNLIDKFDEVPQSTEKFLLMQKRLRSLQNSFAPEIRTLLEQYILGIYFCKNLGGTGISGIVYQNNTPTGGFIILDADMIDQPANDWISSKEQSVFGKSNLNVSIQIEKPENNSRENALRYIFLHEFGHILSVVKNIVPDFREQHRDFSGYAFFKDTWIDENTSNYDNRFPLRKKIRFYSQNTLDPGDNWEQIYPLLDKTPFPTLYSSMHPDEQFADFFVWYVHTHIDRRPWLLEVKKDGETLYRSDFPDSRFAREKSIVKNILYRNKKQ